jgi:hypothetical protein
VHFKIEAEPLLPVWKSDEELYAGVVLLVFIFPAPSGFVELVLLRHRRIRS